MSHTDTQQTPQWAINAAEDVRAAVDIMPNDMNDDNEPTAENLAAIIARHAPSELAELRHDTAMRGVHQHVLNLEARIAELEAENARFLEAFRRIRKTRNLSDAVLIAVVSGSEGPFITAQE